MKRINVLKGFVVALMLVSSSVFLYAGQKEIKSYKLDNGLTVFLNEDHSKPEVFGVVLTKAGGKNDPADATGMAHYMEHMLFKGTTELGTSNWEKEKTHINRIFELYDELASETDEAKKVEIQKQINDESVAAGEYVILNETSKLIKQMGGTNLNAGTGSDLTLFYNSFPSNQLERWMELYSHRFLNPVFRTFQAELEVVYEEKNMYSDMFMQVIIEAFKKNFFKNHPYGQQPLIGTAEHLKKPSLTKMKEFFDTYYVANNMAIVLSGDFNSDEVIPMIEEKFGKWRSVELPQAKVWEETPFNGREIVKVNMSPVKIMLLGFRTVPAGHPDELALEVFNKLLSNENQTGLLDKLMLDNQLMAAGINSVPNNDHGMGMLFVVPKIIGQNFDKAEALVLDQVTKIKNGAFDDTQVEAVKTNIYKEHALSMESAQYKALMIVQAFAQEQNVNDVFNYVDRIKGITKEDIIRVAKKYYGDNYLSFRSKMGVPKGEKVEKPGYEPVISKNENKSEFADRFEKIPASEVKTKFVDFNTDVKTLNPQEGVTVNYVNNTVNDVFTLKMKFGIGEDKLPLLGYASQLINYAGTKDMELDQLKSELNKLGSSLHVYSDDNYLYIKSDGIDKNFNQTLEIINKLISEPVVKQEKINIIVDNEKLGRKGERTDPSAVSEALKNFVLYGEKSDFLDRLSLKEVKKLSTQQLVGEFKKATEYALEINYTGSISSDKIESAVADKIRVNNTLKESASPEFKNINKYEENTVFFVHKKKAVQSQVYIVVNGADYNKKDEPYTEAFNEYFGGGFSGLVLQEIREYRSMAYGASGGFRFPKKADGNVNFYGWLSTQADKTIDALDIYYDLIRNMPEKNSRIDYIKPYLYQSSISDYPNFRNVSSKVEKWKLLGYDQDPAVTKMPVYQSLEFSDIVKYYEKNLKDKPVVIAIVGDKSKIDMEKLAKFGKLIKIKEKKLYKK